MLSKLSVGKRIMVGCASLLVLMLAIGIIAYRSLSGASQGFGEYRQMARDTNLAGELQANMLMVRMNVKNFIISGSQKDIDQYRTYLDKMNDFLAQSQKEITQPERAARIDKVEKELKDYEAGFVKIADLRVESNRLVGKVLDVQGPFMEKTLTDIMESAEKDQDMAAAFHGGLALKHLLLARLNANKFLETRSELTARRTHDEFGNLQKRLDILDRELENSMRRKQLAEVRNAQKIYEDSFSEVVAVITESNDIIGGTLDRIGPVVAAQVKEVKLDIKDVQDSLGPRLVAANNKAITFMITIAASALVLGIILALVIIRGITAPLNRTIEGLSSGADQVASASEQVAASSQSLAEGTSEQAAAIEETSSSLEEMSSMTKQNADNAAQAETIIQQAGKDMDQATTAMSELTDSMNDITAASQETQKIVKTIDEIAFQTNLLALNAAVEAARAGEAGAGFAIVADEVRNLALRAAEAAKNTAGLIEGTVSKIADGSGLVSKTAAAFDEVVAGSRKVSEFVAEISAASAEQAQGIDQVNRAASEMDKVTQQNAANAEESSSAAEELTAQAQEMKSFVEDLQILVSGKNGRRKTAVRKSRLESNRTGASVLAARSSRSQKTTGAGKFIHLQDEQALKDF